MEILTDKNDIRRVELTRADGDKYFVLADVHAFYSAMTRALNEKGFDREDPHHKIILLGDMLDRGDRPRETFEFFKSLKDRFVFVRGNHEDLLLHCMIEFKLGHIPNDVHFLNGTVDTIMRFCGIKSFAEQRWIYEAGDVRRQVQLANRVDYAMAPFVDMILERAVDYATLDDYVFVHGYIPCSYNAATRAYSPITDWREGDWDASRWAHGTPAWKDGVRAEGKTVVCGHWHTSEAHYLYHGRGSEWGDDADFSPFVEDGIIAMDACTAYSGYCNCLTL